VDAIELLKFGVKIEFKDIPAVNKIVEAMFVLQSNPDIMDKYSELFKRFGETRQKLAIAADSTCTSSTYKIIEPILARFNLLSRRGGISPMMRVNDLIVAKMLLKKKIAIMCKLDRELDSMIEDESIDNKYDESNVNAILSRTVCEDKHTCNALFGIICGLLHYV